MHGWDPEGRSGRPFPLPDAVTILEPKEDEPITAPMSESRNQPVASAETAPAPASAMPGAQETPAYTQAAPHAAAF